MKLIAQVKLLTTPEQADALKRTLRLTNTACDYISNAAWKAETFRQYDLHKIVYKETRATFTSLTSQMVVRCIARVADAYKIDNDTKRTFKPLSAITYDDRILRWYADQSTVSIWTVDGRLRIPFVCGESDLVLRKGKFYLFATCNADEPTPDEFGSALGVDFGI
jgi:putative transposase